MPAIVTKTYGTREAGITVTYEDVPLWRDGAASEIGLRLARDFMDLTLQDIAGFVSDAAPVGVSGNLAQSWGGAEGGGRTVTDVAGGIDGRVFSSLPYAIVIDQGRTPGARMPPVDAIQLWVERVLGANARDAESIAWAVARSIAKKGIEARHYVDEGVEKAMPRIQEIWNTFGDALAAELLGKKGAS